MNISLMEEYEFNGSQNISLMYEIFISYKI